jgi:RNA polymerase sigma-70 factor (ECF subfamily)
LKLYDFLYEANPTPVVQLNRAVVLAETGAVESAIQAIMAIPGIEKRIRSDYIFSAVLGDLYKRLSDIVKAREYLEHAHDLTSSHLEKRLMRKKIDEMGLKK